MKDLYHILQVPATATPEQIRRSFRRLSKLYHPDRKGDPARFKELVEAYSILSDPQKRNTYDQTHPPRPKSQPQPKPQPEPSSQSQLWWKYNRAALLNIAFSLLTVLSLIYVGYRIQQLNTSPSPSTFPLPPTSGQTNQFIEKKVDSIDLTVPTSTITAPPTFLDDGSGRDSASFPQPVENY